MTGIPAFGRHTLDSWRLLGVLASCEPLTARQRSALLHLVCQVAAELDSRDARRIPLADGWRPIADRLADAAATGHDDPYPWRHDQP